MIGRRWNLDFKNKVKKGDGFLKLKRILAGISNNVLTSRLTQFEN